MTGMWLVCLSLLVAADAASIAAKPAEVEIPVEVVYEEPILPHIAALKNLEARPQLSTEEKVEAEVLRIPEIIAKLAQPPIQEEVKSEESIESSDEKSSEESLDQNKSSEESHQQESNEIDNNTNLENLRLKLIDPVEKVKEVEVAVPAEETVVPESDSPKVHEVIPEIIQPLVVQEIIPTQDGKPAEQDSIKFVPVQEGQISLRQSQGSTTTAAPWSRPILGLINRLGETIGNSLNSYRPQTAQGSTATPPVAPIQTEAPQSSEESVPIAAASDEKEVVAPSSSAPPSSNFANNLQQNINSQLDRFGNRVNTFIDNLRPRQPTNIQSQNDEQPTTPNTPFINNLQEQFNNGLSGFSNNINNAFNFFNQNATQTQSDEAGEQNTNPIIQTIINGATNFQQQFSQFVGGQNQQQQQSDDAGNSTSQNNIGQQVLQVFQNGISSFVSNFRPSDNNTQSDDTGSSTSSPNVFQNLFGGFGQQFNNFINGQQQNNTIAQNIPTTFPGGSQIPGIGQIPGADQFQNFTSQLSGSQFQNLSSSIPGAEQFQNFTSQLSGSQGQLPEFSLPGGSTDAATRPPPDN